MAYLNDLSRGNLASIERRLYKLEHKATLTNAAIGRDGMEVYDEGVLNISNGTLIVNGYAQISGSLEVSGTSTFSGSLTIAGPTGITGPLTVAGTTDITGALNVTGKTTISNDLELLSGGLFKAGETQIEPNGKATFGTFIIDPASDRLIQAPGGWLFTSGPDTLGLSSSISSSVNLNETYAELNYKGASTVRAEAGLINLSAPKTSVNGNLVVTGTADVTGIGIFRDITDFRKQLRNTGRTTTGNAANVHMNTSGYFFEVTSSARYKLDVQPLDLPDSLLEVPIVDWVDRASQETYDLLNAAPRPFEFEDQIAFDNADLTRIPGALAEDVEAAGGSAFVSYGEDGLPRALAYDRYALARTELLVRRLNAALKRINDLENMPSR